ncbi:restriction endonuclease subunit S [Brassicibacter mesophilus]|uniref:restriction endonuclease subunit S n=1 Tax=Brassicibacter mesophilus TaxID=745119 RepID=UPI003D2094E4
MRLGDVSDIRTGLVLSRKKAQIESDIIKKYKTLTLKSFNEDGILNLDDLEDFDSTEKLDERYLTQKGDVVIRLSHPNTAIYISDNITGYIIPSQFSVIRLGVESLIPEFLSIYLNSTKVKKKIYKSQFGATIPVIKNSFLENLRINDLSIDRQKAIVDIHNLHLKEKELLKGLIDEKEMLFKAVFSQLIK